MRPNAKGTILFQSMVMIVIVAGLAGAMTMLSVNDRTTSNRTMARIAAQAAADGATALAEADLFSKVSTANAFVTDYDGNASINSMRSPRQLAAPMNDPSYSVSDPTFPWTSIRWHVRKVGNAVTITNSDGTQQQGQMYHVWATVYTKSASANADPRLGETTVTVNRIVNIGLESVFHYAIFYGGDLEIMHNATMTVDGKVHANGNMYLDPGNPLTFQGVNGNPSSVHTAGDIFREHPNFPVWAGPLNVAVNGNNVSWSSSEQTSTGNWASYVNSTFTDTTAGAPVVQDQTFGVTPITPPSFQSFQPGGYYDQTAGLNIKYDGTNMTVLLNGANVTANAESSGAVSQTTFWDQRAQQSVNVIDVDISKLGANYPSNGVVYVSRSDSSPAQQNGVRLKNGSTLPGPLTIATNNPVYVKGDFNTGTYQPSAIMADAVTLQSNAWSDSAALNQGQRITPGSNPLNQSGPYTMNNQMPTATQTTYNFAMLAGNTNSNYAAGISTLDNPNQSGFSNGGVNNLPRFLEDWTNINCNYNGSMVCLFQSQIANSPFSANAYVYHEPGTQNPPFPVNGNVYNPPNRNWNYDTRLGTNSPPATPQVASILQTVYWTNP
jgi:Tfp pilus assembly protein PilX